MYLKYGWKWRAVVRFNPFETTAGKETSKTMLILSVQQVVKDSLLDILQE